jgi:hypothetical protein
MRNVSLIGMALVLGGGAAAACSSGSAGTTIIEIPGGGGGSKLDGGAPAPTTTGTTTSAPGTDSGPPTMPGADGGTVATGLPCDVATLLAPCIVCHSDPPIAGSLAGLVTLADLKATSHLDSSKTEAQESAALLSAGASTPMPPGAGPNATGASTLTSWINAGYPAGSCGGTDAGTGTDSGSHPDSAAPPPGDAGGAVGVPCNIATIFASSCTGCHSDPPIAGSLAGLVTYTDLMATSHLNAANNEAQESLALMQAGAATPMPPGGPMPSAADVSALQAWVSAGYPMGASCGGGDGGTDGATMPPPFSVFTGEAPYALGQTSNGNHNAGQDCVGCHDSQGGDDAPKFTFAGTVVDANGNGVGGAEVRLIDANGLAISVYTDNSGQSNRTGNFGSTKAWVAPAHVGVRNASSSQDMLVTITQTQGGCNACHCSGGGSCVTPEVHLP